MLTLTKLIRQRTVVEMKALAHNHGLPFNNRRQREVIAGRLLEELHHGQCLRRAYRRLAKDDRDALRTLQAAGGLLPSLQFKALFGAIRPYRPWVEPLKPWQQPISVAERLWYQGFIGREGEQIALCAEVDSLLPPLPRMQPLPSDSVPQKVVGQGAEALVFDMAMFLGTLGTVQGRTGRGGWLAPYAFKAIARRLCVRDTSVGRVRSELRTGRLRFLHYLVIVAGLAAPLGKRLLPMPPAWAWLEMPIVEKLTTLQQAVRHDLASRSRAWDHFRLPKVIASEWDAVLKAMESLPTNCLLGVQPFIRRLRLCCPTLPAGIILALLRGPLTWLDLVQMAGVEGKQSMIHLAAPDEMTADRQTSNPLQILPTALVERIDGSTNLRALAEIVSWATVDPDAIVIDAEAVRRAQNSGIQRLDYLITLITRLINQPMPSSAVEQIKAWMKANQRLRVEHKAILTSVDPNLLTHLRRDRGMRACFEQPLNPYQIAIRPEAVELLQRRLAQRELASLSPPQGPLPLPEPTNDAAYPYFAMRIVQMVGSAIPLPLPIPGAVSDMYKTNLTDVEVSHLEQMVQTVRERLTTTMKQSPLEDSLVQLASTTMPNKEDSAIRHAIEQAYTQQQSCMIAYYSPYQKAITQRRITPLVPIRWEGDLGYIEAWCALDGAVRTFRLDRILWLIDAPD